MSVYAVLALVGGVVLVVCLIAALLLTTKKLQKHLSKSHVLVIPGIIGAFLLFIGLTNAAQASADAELNAVSRYMQHQGYAVDSVWASLDGSCQVNGHARTGDAVWLVYASKGHQAPAERCVVKIDDQLRDLGLVTVH